MGFTERATEKAAPMGHPCGVRRALSILDETTRADAVDAIRGPALATALADVFEEDGIDISVDQVRRHRAGDCKQCRATFPKPPKPQ